MMSDSRSNVLAKGYTSTIYYHQESSKVVKVLEGDKAQTTFDNERRAYERLSRPNRPSSIIRFFGVDNDHQYGLVLERALHGDLHSYLWHNTPLDPQLKYRWVHQAVEALSFVHSQDIIHCDIHAANFFLDTDYNLKLGDFGAASVNGGPPTMMYRTSHQLWVLKDDKWHRDISVSSEIFALGSVMYNMENRYGPFVEDGKEIAKDEIKERLKARRMPALKDDFVLGQIISKCWSVQYTSMAEISHDIPDDAEESRRLSQTEH